MCKDKFGAARARHRFRLLIFLSLWVGFSVPAAHAGEPLTVDRAVRLARENNRELAAARELLEIARGQLVKARYLNPFNPEIGADAGHRELAAGGSDEDVGVRISQEVEIGGQRGKRIAEAQANLDRIEQLVRDRERLATAQVRRTFFRILERDRRLELLRRVEDLNRRLRDAAATRAEAGESSVMEANLAAIRLAQARKDRLAAEKDRAVALLALQQLLNVSPPEMLVPQGELRPASATYKLDDLLSRARQTRPDLLAAKSEVVRASAAIALTRRLVIPNPTLEGFYRHEGSAEGEDRIAGGGVRIPLPVFDRRQGDLTSLAGRRAQAGYEVDATVRRVESDVYEAFRTYEAARAEVEIFEKDVLARIDENFHFIETAYREGKIGLLDLVVVQNDLVTAQFSYLDSLIDLRLAQVDLEAAVGGSL